MICPFRAYESYPFFRFAHCRIESDPSLTVTTTQIKNKNEKINENLQIPVFHGEINSKILDYINSNIKNDIMEFKQQMETAADENAETLKKQGKNIIPYEVSSSYSITYNKNDILSVSLIYQEYLGGKNSLIRTTYNYNLQTGESIPLKSLFRQGTDYIGILSRKLKEKLQVSYPYIAAQFDRIAEDQPYYLDNNSLVIFPKFNEIAPILAEIPIIQIPLSELSSILKPQVLRNTIDF